MTSAKPIIHPSLMDPSLMDQKLSFSPGLSQRELEELHNAPTHYPDREHFHTTVSKPFQKSSNATTTHSSEHSSECIEEKMGEQKTEHETKEPVNKRTSISKNSTSKKEDHLRLHHEKKKKNDDDKSSADDDDNHSSSSFANGMASLFAQMQASRSSDDTAAAAQASQGRVTQFFDHDLGSDDIALDLEEQHGITADDEKRAEAEVGVLEAQEKAMDQHIENASVIGSAGSSEARLSEAIAATLRITRLLDELTAVVSRMRLENSDGKAMTIQVKPDVLADTNIHIVSSAKQMEVSFLTNNATSNFLLNTHLTTLQNHLNNLCPGQVVTIQTQLTSSANSSHLGNEQDQTHDDLANFDQGNRGKEAREE